MTKRKIILTVMLSILIVLTLSFIWGHSLRTREQSVKDSEAVYQGVGGVFDIIFGDAETSVAVIRKFAHFFEFFMLSVEITALFFNLRGLEKINVLFSLPIGLFTAIVDETIQIFSDGRGALITDVLIDFSGVFLASVFMFLVVLSIQKFKSRKPDKSFDKKALL